MLAALIAASLLKDNPSVAEFFPLTPGARRTYEEKGRGSAVSVDEVGAPETVSGAPATPVVTKESGRAISKTYYRLEGSTLFIVAMDKEHPLPKPLPILQFNGEKTNWSYEGPSDDTKAAEPIFMTGEAKLAGERTFMGKKVATLEVKLVTTVGGGRAQEKIEQVAIYGRGIGLLEATAKTRVGRNAATSTLKLVKVEEAQPGG